MSLYLNSLKNLYCLSVIIILLLTFNTSFGQIKSPVYEVSLSSILSEGDQAPFWLMSNRQGKYLPDKYASSMEFGIFAEPDTGKVFDYGYGLDFFGRVSDKNIDGMLNQAFVGDGIFWIHQAYAQFIFYDLIQLRGGMWEETVGSQEPYLSTGSIIWSGNARPMPKIEIGTPGYIAIPYTQGYVEIKGLLSHGWFEEGIDWSEKESEWSENENIWNEKGRFADNVWLHHKNAYMRLGGSLPVNIHYGFNHFVQWGGSSPRQEKPYPSDFNAFMRIFFNMSGDPDEPGTPDGWVLNREGNSLGSRDIGIELNLDNISAGVYQQDVFDDGSGLRRKNFPDGLWGVWARFTEGKKPVQAVVYEYLQTIDQSGPVHILFGPGGNDNYFNHGHYRSGWTYHKYTIGTPFITSPILNDSTSFKKDYLLNTRVIAHHIGLEGYITENLKYRNLFTYSRNYGTHNYPLREGKKPIEQFSFMVEFAKPLPFFDLEAGITLAGDIGEMYGDNFGMFLTIRRIGGLR